MFKEFFSEYGPLSPYENEEEKELWLQAEAGVGEYTDHFFRKELERILESIRSRWAGERSSPSPGADV